MATQQVYDFRSNVNESLQSYARRVHLDVRQAYWPWHMRNKATAMAWTGEPVRKDGSAILNQSPDVGGPTRVPHVTVRGATCLGFTIGDVRELARSAA